MRRGIATTMTALLALLPGCYDGPDSDISEDTETTGTEAMDTEAADAESGDADDGRPSPPDPSDDDDGGGTGGEDTGPAPLDPNAAIVEFRIQLGTQAEAWNTADQVLIAYVGQTLRLTNDDDVPHTLHSFDAPMPHGEAIEPGDSAEYVLAEPYDRGDESPELWDHEAGEPAYFWLEVLPRGDE